MKLQDTQCTYERNIKVNSHDHGCRGKALSITYYECVPVALGIQLEMRVRRITISSVVCLALPCFSTIPYILESNPHPFYSFRGLKNQMRIRIACGLDPRSRTGFWKNDTAAVRAVRTIQ